jgi:pimeloyl-ACP methyl ester carboxylesterase/KaiC/GvpD/RAD55 family RecA-like ATPase
MDALLMGGYPEKSAILFVGPPVSGKELFGYRFVASGPDDVCVYVTRSSSFEVMEDMRANGIAPARAPHWISSDDESRRYTPDDLANISSKIKGTISYGSGRRNRVVFDSLSSLLVYHSADSVYRFLAQLTAEVKLHNGCFLALLDGRMHPAPVLASIEDLFDGVVHLESEEGGQTFLKIVKMRGANVRPGVKIRFKQTASRPQTVVGSGESTEYMTLAEKEHIRFCASSDGVKIAYATTGKGQPLVKAANWIGHLQFDSRGIWSHWGAELTRYNMLVRFDQRGCGLSDREIHDWSFERFVNDLESVVDSLGLEHFDLLGMSHGGSVSIAYAVRHPERVRHLILYGAFAQGWARMGLSEVRLGELEAVGKLLRSGWGRDSPAFRQIFTTWFMPEATAEQMRGFNDYQKVSASPENAARIYGVVGDTDVLDLLPKVSVPTIVFHVRGDQMVPFRSGLQLASLIPGARFVPLEGRNHILLEEEPAWKAFLSEYRRFIGVEGDSDLPR